MGLLSRANSAAAGITNLKTIEKTIAGPIALEAEVLPELEVSLEPEGSSEPEAALEEIASSETELPFEAEEKKNDFSLDEMGKALSERLKRLPKKKSTPYTVLSLLKAYGGFQTGICLSLKNDSYISYASIGMAVEKLSIPREKIWSGEKAGESYFKLDLQKNRIENIEKDSGYWVFPLDASLPWTAVMILGVHDPSDFNPEPVSALLKDVTDKMILPQTIQNAEDEILSEDTSAEILENGKSNTLEKEITLFHQMYLDFSCIVLEKPDTAPINSDFCEKVSAMLDKRGTVIPLPSGRPLILLPLGMDRELITHRLSKTLKTRPLLSFEANNPENVFTRIASLI